MSNSNELYGGHQSSGWGPQNYGQGAPQQSVPQYAPRYAPQENPAVVSQVPQEVSIHAQQLLSSAPQPSSDLLSWASDGSKIDREALRAPFAEEDVFTLSWGRVPKHKAYVKRLCDLGVPYYYTVLAQAVLQFANDIWCITVSRMAIPGMGISDAVGAVSFRDKALHKNHRGALLSSPNYNGYAPSEKANKSDMDNMWPQYMKLSETNAFTRCAFRLGVGIEQAEDEEDVATFTPPPPPPNGTGFPMPPGPQTIPAAFPNQPDSAGAFTPPWPEAPATFNVQPLGNVSPMPQPMSVEPQMAHPMAAEPQMAFGAPPVPMNPPVPQMPMPPNMAQANQYAPEMPGVPTVNTLMGKPSEEQVQRLRESISSNGVSQEDLSAILKNYGANSIEDLNLAQLGSVENLIKQRGARG